MHSAASITDFDSDGSDYPYHNSGVNNNHNNNSSNSVKSQSYHVHKFGEFEDNYGWIQCRSKSYPDRVYYHNTRSGCNTWYRPISRFIDIPFVTIRRANCTESMESTNDLELMSVSDDEKNPNVSEGISIRNRNRPLIDVSDIVARYYYTPRVDLISNTIGSQNSTDEYVSECYKKEQEDYVNDENDVNNSEAVCSQLFATDFLETKLFVNEDDVDTKGTSRIFNSLLKENTSNVFPYRTKRIVYDVPRLKRISPESQLIKPSRTQNRKASGPRKIISDMYGVRTISYDLPEPDQPCAVVGVKTTTLSASDSDSDSNVSMPPSLLRAKTTLSFDIAKNLRQPLLSDPSSSPSSRSDSTSSSTSRSTNSSSCSCSSCSRKASNEM